jgi:hypothetical protein
MSTETTEKKVYPSQLNSKTISARIPVQDYVDFLNESINLGISLNDFLLRKIYSKNSNVGTINKENTINDELLNFVNGYEFEVLKIDDIQEFWDDKINALHGPEKYNNPIKTDNLLRVVYKRKGAGNYFYTIQMMLDFINGLYMYIDRLKSEKKEASLEDVKIQLSILINNRFSDSKDKRDFKSEVFGLLDELS